MKLSYLLRSLLQEIFIFLANCRRIDRYCGSQLGFSNSATETSSDEQSRLKILLVTPYSPLPAYTGAAIRRMEQICFLGSRYSLAIASFIFSDLDYNLLEKLQESCFLRIPVRKRELKFPRLGQGRSDERSESINKFTSWKMKIILGKLNSLNFDIVLFDSIFMAQYASLFPNSYPILMEQNIESTILARTLDLSKQFADSSHRSCIESELRSLQNYENNTWAHFPLRTVVSEVDRQELDDRCSSGQTIVVKNGVDTQAITFINHSSDSKKILFMGTMSYAPNIDAVCYFVNDILPIIWQSSPEFRLCIAGSNPTSEVYSLASDPRIEIVANPENIGDVSKECSLTVVPLRIGSGTRLKILHAMAMGLPVVSTSLGAEGLEIVDGLHISIRDRPDQFAAAVVRLTSDLSFRSSLQFNARQLVEECYDWRTILTKFEEEMLSELKQHSLKKAGS